MTAKLLLVDYENVQQLDLCALDDDARVLIFVGATQKAIPTDLVTATQPLGTRVEWLRVDANGANALDFHIACHLGRVLETAPATHCTVLSRDKGFDPLLRHLNRLGLRCRRVNSLYELAPPGAGAAEANYRRVVEILGKSQKQARPRRRKTLAQHVAAMFQNRLAQREVDLIVDRLFAERLVSENNGTVSYMF